MTETPERCTCGSPLAENARFCYRCGRPVRALTADEEEELRPPEPTPLPAPVISAPPPPPLPIGFGNPIALRVAFMMSLGLTMTEVLPFVNYLFFAWWLMAGWFAVRIYRRLTGLQLSVSAGARLGFITGLFTFLGIAVLFAFLMASSSGKEVLDQMIKQDPRTADVVNNPTMLGSVLVMVLLMIFAMVSGVCAAGGALGAKFGTPAPPPAQPRA